MASIHPNDTSSTSAARRVRQPRAMAAPATPVAATSTRMPSGPGWGTHPIQR